MTSSSKNGKRLINLDPNQLIPIKQQTNSKQKKKQKIIIKPQNLFNLNSNQNHNYQLLELNLESSHSHSSHNSNQDTIEPGANQMLWSDKLLPTHPSQLAIHPKKLQLVQNWLNDSLNGTNQIKRYRRLLVISGPAGSGKSSIIHSFSHNPTIQDTTASTSAHSNSENLLKRAILPIRSRTKKSTSQPSKSRPLPFEGIGYEILEWKNTGNESSTSKAQEFSAWLMRATAGPTLSFTEGDEATNSITQPRTSKERNEASDKKQTENKLKAKPRRVILVDDLPNLYHQDTLNHFTNSIRFHLNSARPSTPPLIIIMTDTTCKTGEDGLNDSLLNGNQFNQNQEKPLNVHHFLSLDILNHPACYLLKLQPVNKTLMKTFLNRIVDQHYHLLRANPCTHTNTSCKKLSPNQIGLIVDSSAGDLRSALNNLQQIFFDNSSLEKSNPQSDSFFNNNRNPNRQMLSYRDESLVIFHGLGKILFNKRWGDDPVDDAKDKRVCGPKVDKLPPFWTDFERRLGKTDIDKLYSELSVPIQHFIIYLHHNFPQFLNSIEEGSFLLEYLSLTDSTALCLNDNNRYNQILISEFYRFHVTVRSILLSLPTPVIRRNQKFYKPVLWDNLKSINSNIILLDSFRDRRWNNSPFGDYQSLGNGVDVDNSGDYNSRFPSFDSDDAFSVTHSARNLLAVEVLPFLGLITRFRGNSKFDTNQTSLNSKNKSTFNDDDLKEIVARFTKFNYPQDNQKQEINEEDIGDEDEDEDGTLKNNCQNKVEDYVKNQGKNLEMIHHHFTHTNDGHQVLPDENLWFEDEDDIIDD